MSTSHPSLAKGKVAEGRKGLLHLSSMHQSPEQPAAFWPKTTEESILATLAFFSLFHHPLTLDEIRLNLIKTHPLSPSLRAESEQSEDEARQSPSPANLETIITELLGHGTIITDGNLYALPDHEADFEHRTRMAPILRKRLTRVRRFAPLLHHIPFVRGVFLCNNLSFGIATETGDIDLLIVTAPGHIFTARFLATALFHLLGIRRHGEKTTDRFCLSFYVTDDNLDFSTFALQPQDIYLTYWTRHLIPCFPSEAAEEITEANRKWLRGELDMVEWEEEKNIKQKDRDAPLSPEANKGGQGGFLQRLLELSFRTALGRRIETWLATYQKKKLTQSFSTLHDTSGTIISDTILKFHDWDRRMELQRAWSLHHQNHE